MPIGKERIKKEEKRKEKKGKKGKERKERKQKRQRAIAIDFSHGDPLNYPPPFVKKVLFGWGRRVSESE